MPKMVTIAANPAFKPEEKQKVAFALIVKAGARTVPYPTALENIKQSDGMYAIKPDGAKVVAARALEDMSTEELKVMMISLGVKTEKQMTRGDVVGLIRAKLNEVDISDDA